MDKSGASSSSAPAPPSAAAAATVLRNYPLVSAIVAFALAQSLKFFTTWYKEKRWDVKLLIGSGGMPSSHSATVTALAVAIGFEEGFGSSVFATASILACVVMYDAFGIRLHAGRQAEVLNQIVYELPDDHPLADTRPLRELLGHTPPQIWIHRNAVRHEEQKTSSSNVLNHIQKMIQEQLMFFVPKISDHGFEKQMLSNLQFGKNPSTKKGQWIAWSPPPPPPLGSIKCNFDASYKACMRRGGGGSLQKCRGGDPCCIQSI